MLVGRNLTKSLGGRIVLQNLDIHVEAGEILAVRGPSGSGKSTLLKALSLIDPPNSGSVQIGSAIYDFPRDKHKKLTPWPELTVVFQQHFLWPHLTLEENILLPVKERGASVAKEDFEWITKLLGMLPFLRRFPNEVSAGERQRAAIARAVMLNPRILLLDEVTSFLDEIQLEALVKVLFELRGRKIATLLITHDRLFAEQVADRSFQMPSQIESVSTPTSILHLGHKKTLMRTSASDR